MSETPGTSFPSFNSFTICDPQQSSIDRKHDKNKKAFFEQVKELISQSDSGCHFSAPMEDRTALQSSAPYQLMAEFVGRRWPKFNPSSPLMHPDGVAVKVCLLLPLLCTVFLL